MRSRLFLITVVILLAAIGSVGWAWWDLHRPAPLPAGGAMLSVNEGEPFRATTEKLGSAGIVRHPLLLHWYARWSGTDRLIQTGDYRFLEPVSPVQVLETLRTAAMSLNRVTIPEGLTVKQIAAQLEAAGFGGSDEYVCAAQDTGFLKEVGAPPTGLEGYLFPDTYAFPMRTAPRDILRTMVKRAREQLDTLNEERSNSSLSEIETLTLASIVEKETGVAPERGLVSSVFHNRMRVGMRLQSDPTAVYGWKDGPPTAADLKIDSPYNTYVYQGLPPGPICNPGLAAIRAALVPASTPYFFFVARPDGTHEFSTTLDEHNRAVSVLRRSGG